MFFYKMKLINLQDRVYARRYWIPESRCTLILTAEFWNLKILREINKRSMTTADMAHMYPEFWREAESSPEAIMQGWPRMQDF